MKKRSKHALGIFLVILACFLCLVFFLLPNIFPDTYRNEVSEVGTASPKVVDVEKPTVLDVTHIKTPEQVKAIYMTSWVAGTPSLRQKLVSLIDTTEINSVVIDVKDYTGRISFEIKNSELKKFGSEEIRVRDLRELLAELHKKNVYTIARIAVFQDAYMVKMKPEWAVKNLAGTAVWKDRKGISWIDPGTRDYWKYMMLIAQESYDAGFDEINFDYIRYPSDGNMKDISYPWSKSDLRHEVMKSFFEHIHTTFASSSMVTSADLFGMTTSAVDDMGIGQLLEDALPNFDYIAPMVYPSHYPPAWNGYKNPAAYPYEVIYKSMGDAVARAKRASTSPLKLRPWLQDFDLGADYGPAEVRKQIQATYDLGLTSWMLWSASNKYTSGALDAQ